ncbi:5-carboxymethyl-2-hydroxymuconate Delta-isomerase [Flavisolibacter ginsenosidimutans]|uniref:5-carboxymethyl-2-hydroxymuconate Delta-isomerase n=2 Tax=Flavisolibacter ginsenosidimutans TaxID=661481 RepID=A0A5B8UQM1_9BACT|nr:5-carboxymethyl-2-hydroxymuconate Delta-isomerase [Flavisolibacter ginsenosidimutans]
MPHFIIDCSENVLTQRTPEEMMQAVYDVAESTALFAQNDIKVRLNPYTFYKLGENKKDFIHVFAHIMQGRSTEQKATLSRKTIERLNELFPNLSILSMNVQEFDASTYCNKSLIHPQNTTGNRHF